MLATPCAAQARFHGASSLCLCMPVVCVLLIAGCGNGKDQVAGSSGGRNVAEPPKTKALPAAELQSLGFVVEEDSFASNVPPMLTEFIPAAYRRLSVQSLKGRAEQADAGAQAVLGLRYLWELGVPKNEAEGWAWIRKAAEAGN